MIIIITPLWLACFAAILILPGWVTISAFILVSLFMLLRGIHLCLRGRWATMFLTLSYILFPPVWMIIFAVRWLYAFIAWERFLRTPVYRMESEARLPSREREAALDQTWAENNRHAARCALLARYAEQYRAARRQEG